MGNPLFVEKGKMSSKLPPVNQQYAVKKDDQDDAPEEHFYTNENQNKGGSQNNILPMKDDEQNNLKTVNDHNNNNGHGNQPMEFHIQDRDAHKPDVKSRRQKSHHTKTAIFFFVSQTVIIILFGMVTTFSVEVSGSGKATGSNNTIQQYYPMFQDVHVMIFIGFGFLMTFLKFHSWSS